MRKTWFVGLAATLALAACDDLLTEEPDATTGTISGRLTLGIAAGSGFYRPKALPEGLAHAPPQLQRMVAAARRLTPRERPRLGTTRDGPAVVAGEVLVRMEQPGEELASVIERVRLPGFGFRYRAGVGARWHLVEAVQAGNRLTRSETLEVAARIAALPGVSSAEPNRRFYALGAPSDTFYKYQWHLGQMQLPAAWDLTRGSGSITVAVIDNGILAGHPDLAGRLLPGIDMISDPTIAGDGDGRDDDPNDEGRDQANGESSWHGTHVAGTIGAASNNAHGVAGVDWSCRILPVRALGRGGGTTADIAAAMSWAIGLPVSGSRANPNPAQVVNMSLGGDGGPSQVYQDVIDEGTARGVVFVVAAGNENEDTAGKAPANQRDVVTVGAVAYTGKKASYSNWGAEVDLVAPGGEMAEDADGDGYADGVLSTGHVDGAYGYVFMQGTSMAAPHVAGVVALMKGLNPGLQHAQVESMLKGTAVSAFQCAEGCGAGLVSAYAAVLQAGGQVPSGAPELFVPNRDLTLAGALRGAIPVANRGGGSLTVRAVPGGELAGRLSFPAGDSRTIGAASADALEVAVDASGLGDGVYGANLNLDAGAAGSAAVRVNFRLGGQAEGRSGVVAALYLDELDEWQLGGGVEFTSAATLDYRIPDLEPRDYFLLAGVDDDGNGELFDDGERMGIWRNLDSPEIVEVTAGQEVGDVDFALIAVGVAPTEDTGPVPVGAPCATKADCGVGGLCDTTLPGGYCWKECPGGASDCPGASACFGDSSPLCLATCAEAWAGQSNCRSGYLCWSASPAPACLPPCDDASCQEGTYCDHSTGYCTYL